MMHNIMNKKLGLILCLCGLSPVHAVDLTGVNAFFINGYAASTIRAGLTLQSHNKIMQPITPANASFILLHNRPPEHGWGFASPTGLIELFRNRYADATPAKFLRALHYKTYYGENLGNMPGDVAWWSLLKDARIEEANASVSDYENFYKTILSSIKSTGNRKTIIVAHSEGTIFANQVTDYIIKQDATMQKCIGVVNVGAVVSRVANNTISPAWVTSHDDWIINTIVKGLADPDPLPSNVATSSKFNDATGHAYIETYAVDANLKTAIVNRVTTLKAKLDAECTTPPQPCGQPINVSGEQLASPQTYTINLGGQQGRIQWEFEAYSIPDEYKISVNGKQLATSNGLKSGYSSGAFDVLYAAPPKNNTATITVGAPKLGTAWYANMGCPGKQVQNMNREKVVIDIGGNTGDTNCKSVELFLNDQSMGSANAWGWPQFEILVSKATGTSSRNVVKWHYSNCRDLSWPVSDCNQFTCKAPSFTRNGITKPLRNGMDINHPDAWY